MGGANLSRCISSLHIFMTIFAGKKRHLELAIEASIKPISGVRYTPHWSIEASLAPTRHFKTLQSCEQICMEDALGY